MVFPNENASSVRKRPSRRATAERDILRECHTPNVTPDVTPPVTRSRVTASDPLTEPLLAVAKEAGVGDPEGVWRKFTAWNDGQDRAMPRDWRLWCLRERSQPSVAAPIEEAEDEPRAPRENEGPLTLLPESECVPIEEMEANMALIQETLRTAGRGGRMRKAPNPTPSDPRSRASRCARRAA